MNKELLHKNVQEFLEQNYQEEISKIIFKGSPFSGISSQELAVQLTGKKKAEKKLPSWFSSRGILYPPTLNLEQTSSEKTAEYKASLVKGSSLVDLTGGFGIDSFLFSKNIEKVVHCEINGDLSEIATHNAQIFGKDNLRFHSGDGIEFLKSSSAVFDWIYIDPSRRDHSGGRIFKLSDCLPDVPSHLELLFEKGKRILIKTSPLLDLQAGIRELKNVSEIHIVAVDNEVKELLWILEKDPSKEIRIKTINFRKKGNQEFEAIWGSKHNVELTRPLSYLYEPNAAIMKSGVFETLGETFHLLKLHSNTHLFTSEELKDFPGRRFKIEKTLPYKKKALKSALKEGKAHVTTRNFPETVMTIRNKFSLKEGGNTYLFFTTIENNEKVILWCTKR